MHEAAQELQGGNAQLSKTAKTKSLIIIAILVVLIVGGYVSGLGKKLGELREWINGLGWLAPVVFVLIYAGATVAAVPGSALTLFAGSVFGSVKGVVIVSIASTLGATLAFIVARYFMRKSITEWLSTNEKFRKLDEMTERHGDMMVAFTRLVPLFPFNLLNYGFGLTKVPMKTYVFWSWLCMLPGTVLYIVGGDAVTKAISERRIPWVLVVVGLVVLAIIAAIGNKVRRILAEKESA